MSFAEDDDVVEALAANGADEAFREWILPGRMRGGLDLFDAKPALVGLLARGDLLDPVSAQSLGGGEIWMLRRVQAPLCEEDPVNRSMLTTPTIDFFIVPLGHAVRWPVPAQEVRCLYSNSSRSPGRDSS